MSHAINVNTLVFIERTRRKNLIGSRVLNIAGENPFQIPSALIRIDQREKNMDRVHLGSEGTWNNRRARRITRCICSEGPTRKLFLRSSLLRFSHRSRRIRFQHFTLLYSRSYVIIYREIAKFLRKYDSLSCSISRQSFNYNSSQFIYSERNIV